MIAVVIPTINCRPYLEKAVASLEPYWDRLTLLDNGSTDDTPHWMSGLAHPISTIRLIRNIGVAPAWNLLIGQAFRRGADQVVVLNHDLEVEPDTIAVLAARNRAGLALPTVHPVADFARPVEHGVARPGDFCGFLITPAVVDRVGWFDEAFEIAYCEDLDYELRCLNAGVPHGRCLDARVRHAGSAAITYGQVEFEAAFQRNQAYFQRKWGMHHEVARQRIRAAGAPT